MRGISQSKRRSVVRRGLEFINSTARDPKNFESYGHDYLCCFYCIAATSGDPSLRDTARKLGRDFAHQWRREHPQVLSTVDADSIVELIFGSDAADRLGLRDRRFKQQLREAAGNFTVREYFSFDPKREPPPTDVPDDCECGAANPRGRLRCLLCDQPLNMFSRYGVWLDAITSSYVGERYGVRLGTTFADVLKWLPAMRPYPKYDDGDNRDFYWAVYAVTHVVYALNDYSFYNLSPRWLTYEYEFLKRNVKKAIVMEDPETLGEFLDTLKSFGLPDNDPLILRGEDYLIQKQNDDGSWGDLEVDDIYQRYHPTWTALDGLRDYAWQGERLSLLRLKPLVQGWTPQPL